MVRIFGKSDTKNFENRWKKKTIERVRKRQKRPKLINRTFRAV